MSKKIGLYGGAFDPIHQGHLMIANEVKTQLNLDEIWLIPSFQSPLKENKPYATSEQRLAILNLAVQNVEWLKITDIEIKQEQTSYTYDTVTQLKQMYSDTHFYFIIGGDRLADLHLWHRIDELLQLIDFVAVQRPYIALPDKIPNQVHLIKMPLIELSSTLIRQKCFNQQSISFLLPYECEKYIKENHLYERTTSDKFS